MRFEHKVRHKNVAKGYITLVKSELVDIKRGGPCWSRGGEQVGECERMMIRDVSNRE